MKNGIGNVTAVGFEPTPLRTGALSQRLRPLGQTVLSEHAPYSAQARAKQLCGRIIHTDMDETAMRDPRRRPRITKQTRKPPHDDFQTQ